MKPCTLIISRIGAILTNNLVTTGSEDYGITLDVMDEYPDILCAVRYLLLKEVTYEETGERMSMQEITDSLHNEYPFFPTTRNGAYMRIERWRRDGTLRVATEIAISPKIEEMRASVARAISSMPDLIDKMIDDVKTGKAKSKSLDIVMWLYAEIVKPSLAEQRDPGSIEKNWLQKTKNFAPTDVE